MTDLGFRGLGFGVSGLGFGVQGLRVKFLNDIVSIIKHRVLSALCLFNRFFTCCRYAL